ncbi:MAG TPA: 50S ribosomal protein L11 methyltransferase [Chitinivibrionales bacterium]|nr:50S ribosomal protein L11 methyltransferase [Chitinivibrionales bacterium]
MRAYCLTCELPPEASERAQAIWYGLGMLGCEEEEAKGRIRLKCYFSTSAALHTAEFYLMDLNPCQPISISVVKDEDWNAKWKQSMKPVQVVNGVWVAPVWLRPPMASGDTWIKIEPKMAFGTGHHETTRLACKALAGQIARAENPPAALDIGTGSGILCFLADLCKTAYAVGIDVDPVCASNLAENLRKNRARSRISFAIGSLDIFKNDGLFDIAVMNLISSEGTSLLDRISQLLKPRGVFIWSGLLLNEKNRTLEILSKKNFTLKSDARENEWWCAVFRKNPV